MLDRGLDVPNQLAPKQLIPLENRFLVSYPGGSVYAVTGENEATGRLGVSSGKLRLTLMFCIYSREGRECFYYLHKQHKPADPWCPGPIALSFTLSSGQGTELLVSCYIQILTGGWTINCVQ